jgi:hypothetical protein
MLAASCSLNGIAQITGRTVERPAVICWQSCITAAAMFCMCLLGKGKVEMAVAKKLGYVKPYTPNNRAKNTKWKRKGKKK